MKGWGRYEVRLILTGFEVEYPHLRDLFPDNQMAYRTYGIWLEATS